VQALAQEQARAARAAAPPTLRARSSPGALLPLEAAAAAAAACRREWGPRPSRITAWAALVAAALEEAAGAEE
jgi:hypothetical protein